MVYGMRDGRKLAQPKVRTETHGINSFRYQSAKIWNSLPTKIKESQTLTEFKLLIKNWNIECTCGFCKFCRVASL